MTPGQAERYLLSRELFGMRFGLERMQRLMTTIGSPQCEFDSIHVLGTNGKSSTTRMIAAILARHELRAGAYLSPHIRGFSERIEIDGAAITEQRFAQAVGQAARGTAIVERTLDVLDRVTQFEALTASAYWALARAGVEVAVIEAGLGGRYDATSVITPKVSVVTNIGLDHTRWLGPTVRDIASEKLAAVPEGGCIVAGPLASEVLAVAEHTATGAGASLLLAGRDFSHDSSDGTLTVRTQGAVYGGIRLRALGGFQHDNFALAAAAAEAYRGSLDAEAVRAAAGLSLPGRLERVGQEPPVYLDGAHNPDAVRALVAALGMVMDGRRPVAVVSILDDKDAAGMLAALLPACSAVVFTRSSHPRALPPATLASLARQLGHSDCEVRGEPKDALRYAVELVGRGGAVLVAGSIYLLGDLTSTIGEVGAASA